MATQWQKLSCSTCGGALEYKGELLVCKYCKSTYEVREEISEALVIQLNGANVDKNRFRFDDALEKYSLILKDYPDNAEANWGAFLCSYGIIYEEDYNGEYKPTCHRLSERPVEKSPYYAKLTAGQKQRAQEIEKLRQRILAETKNIQPYDVFICYKQNQERGGVSVPTREAKWARDTYEMLSRQGLRVFYAEKSLAGSNADYEPHIYAALRSAKLMFVLTTSLEHLHSVWVANEWKRYVSYIRAGENKTVRVVYDSIEPYDLPKELQAKQAIDQDGDWIGAVNAAVAEVFQKAPELQKRRTYEEKTYARKEVQGGQVEKRQLQVFEKTAIPASESTQLKTAESMMSVGEYKGAAGILRGVLAANRACSKAYLDLFLCENECANADFFTGAKKPVTDFKNYEAALASAATDEEKRSVLNMLYCRVLYAPQVETLEEFIALPDVEDEQVRYLCIAAYRTALKTADEKLFASVIKTVSDTDTYIEYNFGMGKAVAAVNPKSAIEYFDNVLAVDEGHQDSLLYKLMAERGEKNVKDLYAKILTSGDFSRIEKIYEYGYYADLTQGLFDAVLGAVNEGKNTDKTLKLADFVLDILPESQNEKYAEYLDTLKAKLLKKGQYAAAIKYIDRKLAFNANDDNAYFQKVLAKNKTGDVLQLAKTVDTVMEDEDFLNAINARAKNQPDEAENLYMQVYKKLVFAKKKIEEHNFPLAKYKQIYAPTVSAFLKISDEEMEKFFGEEKGKAIAINFTTSFLLCSLTLVALGILMIAAPHISFALLHWGWWVAIFLVGGVGLAVIGIAIAGQKGVYTIKGIVTALGGLVAVVLMISGTSSRLADATYSLRSVWDFNLLNNAPYAYTANFIVENDIDFKGGSLPKLQCDRFDGRDWEPYSYRGTFDGQGHTLKNIKAQQTEDNHTGVFVKALYGGGSIKNVVFENVEVIAYSRSGNTYSESCPLIYENYGTVENVTMKNYRVTVSGQNLWGNNETIFVYENYDTIKNCRFYDCGVFSAGTGEAQGYYIVDYTGSSKRHNYLNQIEVFNQEPLPEGKEVKVARETYDRAYYNYLHIVDWVIATPEGYTEYYRSADTEWVMSKWGDYPTPCTGFDD